MELSNIQEKDFYLSKFSFLRKENSLTKWVNGKEWVLAGFLLFGFKKTQAEGANIKTEPKAIESGRDQSLKTRTNM